MRKSNKMRFAPVSFVLVAVLFLFSCQNLENEKISSANNAAEEVISNTPSPQITATFTLQPTLEPTITLTPTITPTPNPFPEPSKFRTSGNGTPPREFRYVEDGGPVTAVAFSPDTKFLGMAGNGEILIVNLQTATFVTPSLVGHTDTITKLSWSADGSFLASSSIDGTVRIWTASDFSLMAILNPGPSMDLDWAPNSHKLAVCLESGIVQVWEEQSDEFLPSLEIPVDSPTSSIDWSPSNEYLAVGTQVGDITLFNAITGEKLSQLTLPENESSGVTKLAFSPDGRYLVSAQHNGKMSLWDVYENNLLFYKDANEGSLNAIAWSPDSALIASAGEDPNVSIWLANSGEKISGMGTAQVIWSLDWSMNGKYIATGTAGFPHITKTNPNQNEIDAETGFAYLWLRIQ